MDMGVIYQMVAQIEDPLTYWFGAWTLFIVLVLLFVRFTEVIGG